MTCHHKKKQFKLTIKNKVYELTGLDDCVFGTLISFPENDNDIAEMMWEQLLLSNSLSEDKKEAFAPVLVNFYHEHKEEYSVPQLNCYG